MRLKILSALVFVIIASSGTSYSQDNNLEIAVDVKPVTGFIKKDGAITITITRGNPEYKFFLFDVAPKSGVEPYFQTDWQINPTYTIDNLKKGDYYILVYNKNEDVAAKKIVLSNNKE